LRTICPSSNGEETGLRREAVEVSGIEGRERSGSSIVGQLVEAVEEAEGRGIEGLDLASLAVEVPNYIYIDLKSNSTKIKGNMLMIYKKITNGDL
jgi:hypothetical protein